MRPDEVAIGSALCVGLATEEEKAARIGSRPGMCGGYCVKAKWRGVSDRAINRGEAAIGGP